MVDIPLTNNIYIYTYVQQTCVWLWSCVKKGSNAEVLARETKSIEKPSPIFGVKLQNSETLAWIIILIIYDWPHTSLSANAGGPVFIPKVSANAGCIYVCIMSDPDTELQAIDYRCSSAPFFPTLQLWSFHSHEKKNVHTKIGPQKNKQHGNQQKKQFSLSLNIHLQLPSSRLFTSFHGPPG